jgi:hypothetical protein
MELMSVQIKNSRQKSAGSLKKNIPTSTLYSKYILMLMVIKKPTTHNTDVVPDVSFAFPKQVVKPTSNNPAIMRMIQFMIMICTC